MVVWRPWILLLLCFQLVLISVTSRYSFHHSSVNSKLTSVFQKLTNDTLFNRKDTALADKINTLASYDFEVTLRAAVGVFNIANLFSMVICSKQETTVKSAALNIVVSSLCYKTLNVINSLSCDGLSEEESNFSRTGVSVLQGRMDEFVQMETSQIVVYCIIALITNAKEAAAVILIVRELPFFLRIGTVLLISAIENSDALTALVRPLFSESASVNQAATENFDAIESADLLASVFVFPFELIQGSALIASLRQSFDKKSVLFDLLRRFFVFLLSYNYILVRYKMILSNLNVYLSQGEDIRPVLSFLKNRVTLRFFSFFRMLKECASDFSNVNYTIRKWMKGECQISDLREETKLFNTTKETPARNELTQLPRRKKKKKDSKQ